MNAHSAQPPQSVLCLATQGSGSNDEKRILDLLEHLSPKVISFDRSRKLAMFFQLVGRLRRDPTSLLCIEGTGIAAGLAAILSRIVFGARYLVSTGDAAGPWVGTQYPALVPFWTLYERLLYRYSRGVIGWTPYLAGRALTYGAPRAMTAPGWSPFDTSQPRDEARTRIRRNLGIGPDVIVIGIAGSLQWARGVGYCYGLELALAISQLKRTDVHGLILGDGTGVEKVREAAGEALGQRLHIAGKVPRQEVPDYLAAMDIGSLPQSVDAVGSFRYTTKLSEYLSAPLPVVTTQIPMAYDLPGDWMWRLPGHAPWSTQYVQSLTNFLERISHEEIAKKRDEAHKASALFDKESQKKRVEAFIKDILQT